MDPEQISEFFENFTYHDQTGITIMKDNCLTSIMEKELKPH